MGGRWPKPTREQLGYAAESIPAPQERNSDYDVLMAAYPDARIWEHAPGDWQVAAGSPGEIKTYGHKTASDAISTAAKRIRAMQSVAPLPAVEGKEKCECGHDRNAHYNGRLSCVHGSKEWCDCENFRAEPKPTPSTPSPKEQEAPIAGVLSHEEHRRACMFNLPAHVFGSSPKPVAEHTPSTDENSASWIVSVTASHPDYLKQFEADLPGERSYGANRISVCRLPQPDSSSISTEQTFSSLEIDELCCEWGSPEYVMTDDGEAWYWRFSGHDLPVADNLSELFKAAQQLAKGKL